MSVIDKKYREKCWSARDNYWTCLDSNGEENDKCLKFRQLFEESCPNAWVLHFDQKRDYNIFRRQLDIDRLGTDRLKAIKQ